MNIFLLNITHLHDKQGVQSESTDSHDIKYGSKIEEIEHLKKIKRNISSLNSNQTLS